MFSLILSNTYKLAAAASVAHWHWPGPGDVPVWTEYHATVVSKPEMVQRRNPSPVKLELFDCQWVHYNVDHFWIEEGGEWGSG